MMWAESRDPMTKGVAFCLNFKTSDSIVSNDIQTYSSTKADTRTHARMHSHGLLYTQYIYNDVLCSI